MGLTKAHTLIIHTAHIARVPRIVSQMHIGRPCIQSAAMHDNIDKEASLLAASEPL